MINYIIVDDDEMQIDFLRMQLDHIEELNCLEVCTNAFDARKKIIELKPDLLILDIEMPELSGIQLVKSIKEVPAVIFVTSHTGYALEAFDVEAIDYIVKPVAPERLIRASWPAILLLNLLLIRTPFSPVTKTPISKRPIKTYCILNLPAIFLLFIPSTGASRLYWPTWLKWKTRCPKVCSSGSADLL